MSQISEWRRSTLESNSNPILYANYEHLISQNNWIAQIFETRKTASFFPASFYLCISFTVQIENNSQVVWVCKYSIYVQQSYITVTSMIFLLLVSPAWNETAFNSRFKWISDIGGCGAGLYLFNVILYELILLKMKWESNGNKYRLLKLKSLLSFLIEKFC